MLYAPLEQFQLIVLFKLNIFGLKLIVTNFLIINLLLIFIVASIVFLKNVSINKISYPFFIAKNWQKLIEIITSTIVIQLIINSINKNNEKFLILVTIVFNFILFSNLAGLIPYSFTITSHLYVTFTFSFTIFIGINLITIKKYGLKTFLLFFPANTSIYLAIILVPIELISYLAKPISLGVRLFINLMAGHTLLKVIVGFAWELLILENKNSLLLIFPMLILVILFSLELAVAIIQTYVFVILICIYIQDCN